MGDPYQQLLEAPRNEDGTSWRTVRTVIYVCGIAAAVFMAGMSYGQSADVGNRLERSITDAQRSYVRKDGRELEAINGRLELLSQKLDLLLVERGLKTK